MTEYTTTVEMRWEVRTYKDGKFYDSILADSESTAYAYARETLRCLNEED